MTIFDSIRCPISDSITYEEMNRIPNTIFNYWYMKYYGMSNATIGENLPSLRRLIAEYNTDNCEIKKFYDNLR